MLGRWRGAALGREWRIRLGGVCELHDETAVGPALRLGASTDELALVEVAKWLIAKWPELDDPVDERGLEPANWLAHLCHEAQLPVPDTAAAETVTRIKLAGLVKLGAQIAAGLEPKILPEEITMEQFWMDLGSAQHYLAQGNHARALGMLAVALDVLGHVVTGPENTGGTPFNLTQGARRSIDELFASERGKPEWHIHVEESLRSLCDAVESLSIKGHK